MRVFIGTAEIASLLTNYSEGFRELGLPVTTYVKKKNKFYNSSNYDIMRNLLIDDLIHYSDKKYLPRIFSSIIRKIDKSLTPTYLKWKNKKLIEDHDLFIFIWQSWLPESYLFPLLKKKGKKIVCLHVGSEVRHISAFEQEYGIDTSSWEEWFHIEPLKEKMRKIRFDELYADLIYSVPDQTGLYIRDYNHLYLPLSKQKFIEFKIPGRKVPLILHAPSKSGIKGTALVNSTIKRLKDDGFKFDYKEIAHVPHEELLKLLCEADILCDELYLHGPGVLSVEGMAAGCAVATRCLNLSPFTPPVCAITPENIYESLKRLITDIPYRIQLAKEGHNFIQKYNSPAGIASSILKDLNMPLQNPDYKATFFVNHYKLPSGTSLPQSLKELNRLVLQKFKKDSPINLERLKEKNLI